LGENLWRRFLPKYLQSLGAPITAIGLFGTAEDFLDGVYQYPGGWIADRYGRRAALLVLVSLTMIGYALFAVLPSWPLAFLAIALGLLALLVAARVRIPVLGDEKTINVRHVWMSFPDSLRWLLASDIFIRTCEGMVDVFLVIYAINIVHISAPQFGILVAIQAATAMIVYVPAARIAEYTGKKPFVLATFCCFA